MIGPRLRLLRRPRRKASGSVPDRPPGHGPPGAPAGPSARPRRALYNEAMERDQLARARAEPREPGRRVLPRARRRCLPGGTRLRRTTGAGHRLPRGPVPKAAPAGSAPSPARDSRGESGRPEVEGLRPGKGAFCGGKGSAEAGAVPTASGLGPGARRAAGSVSQRSLPAALETCVGLLGSARTSLNGRFTRRRTLGGKRGGGGSPREAGREGDCHRLSGLLRRF